MCPAAYETGCAPDRNGHGVALLPLIVITRESSWRAEVEFYKQIRREYELELVHAHWRGRGPQRSNWRWDHGLLLPPEELPKSRAHTGAQVASHLRILLILQDSIGHPRRYKSFGISFQRPS